jgi:6-pyruvoyltetrahydropterin/6-carboxytetrahydropterin synthase
METQPSNAQNTGDSLMEMEIYKEFTFEAAHRLPNVPEGHKCANLHGHSYVVKITVDAPVDPKTGWVQDFSDLGDAFAPFRAQLDHQYLNDVPGLLNPTCEVLAEWLFWKLKEKLQWLSEVEVKETKSSGCIFRDRGKEGLNFVMSHPFG